MVTKRRPAAAPKAPTLHDRASGVLLHPTSLPGPYGAGDLGPPAHAFAEWLHRAGQRWWQMLPVGPVGFGNSPYSSLSALAGSPLLVSLDALADEGLLPTLRPPTLKPAAQRRVDYAATARFREHQLRLAWDAFVAKKRGHAELERFRAANADWLPEYALFSAIKRAHGGVAWWDWPEGLRRREPAALEEARARLRHDIAFWEFVEWQFERSFAALRRKCESLGIGLIGDLPIFVAHDSADVWARRELFHIDDDGHPVAVSGVPPDYFSATGQRWGNPLYKWPVLKQRGYDWWIARVKKALERFHAVRLDHFIGFERYWEIPATCPTAVDGKWVPGPSDDLFSALKAALAKGDTLPLIAEDLGLVTPEVTALRDRWELPGIKILQFAFGTDPQAPAFKPHNYVRNCVAYTGTHDNDTSTGWYHDVGGKGSQRSRAQVERERRDILAYLGAPEGSGERDIAWQMTRTVLASVANLAIVPMQDLLALGTEARMNLPGTSEGNWSWRVDKRALGRPLAERLRRLAEVYERTTPEA